MTNDRWYMPGSVLHALWGNVMPKLAASVWRGEIEWPPTSTSEELAGGLLAYTLDEEAFAKVSRQLVRNSFRRSASESWEVTEKAYVKAAKDRNRLTNGQWCTLVATEYFVPGAAAPYLPNRPPPEHRLRLRVIEAEGYDFVLSDEGLDLFVPPKPGANGLSSGHSVEGKKQEEAAREEVLKLYKFRETSKPPIGLPRAPATAFPPSGSGGESPSDAFITIPQLTAPTGAHQLPELWIRAMANEVAWWVSGSLYRGVMAAFPRIVASKWYEEVAWSASNYTAQGGEKSYADRFDESDGLKELVEERVETVLPKELHLYVPSQKKRPSWVKKGAAGWNERDIMISSEGFFFPDPGKAPKWSELAKAIETGVAGNPVFTDSGPDCK